MRRLSTRLDRDVTKSGASRRQFGSQRGQLRTVTTPLIEAAPPRVRGQRGDPQKFAVDVQPSRIDGQGAFAAEAIPQRRKIGEIRGEAISVREARRRAKGT